MSKGQGLSLNTIVIATIVLTVFVVLVAIFSGKMGDTSSELDDRTNCLCINMVGQEMGGKTVEKAQCGSKNSPPTNDENWEEASTNCEKFNDCYGAKDTCYVILK